MTASRWWLDDAERLHQENPESFFIPPESKRKGLLEGDDVKLIFRFDAIETEPGFETNGERMWVRVKEVGDGSYLGELLNDPQHIRDLPRGSLVAFKPQHVAAFAYPPDELEYNPESVAVVSRRIRENHEKPAFVYRNPPALRDGDDDSGWQLFAAKDDDAFISDPNNILWWQLGWIADRYPEIEKLLRQDADAGEWFWDPEGSEYVRRA